MRTRPDVILEEVIEGHTIRRDEHGFLLEPDEWNEDVARHLAGEEQIELEEEHWAIIEFMRAYQEEHQIAADARFVFRFLAKRHDESTSAARRRFFTLFPYGYVKQACKIAGMRQPRAWSTG